MRKTHKESQSSKTERVGVGPQGALSHRQQQRQNKTHRSNSSLGTSGADVKEASRLPRVSAHEQSPPRRGGGPSLCSVKNHSPVLIQDIAIHTATSLLLIPTEMGRKKGRGKRE